MFKIIHTVGLAQIAPQICTYFVHHLPYRALNVISDIFQFVPTRTETRLLVDSKTDITRNLEYGIDRFHYLVPYKWLIANCFESLGTEHL
jgi:hypothetical protein